MLEQVSIASLVRQYDRPGPRYTSYPTAVEFTPAFDEAAYRGRLQLAASQPDAPLSLYLHLPFCEERCSYCGCAMIAARKREVATEYCRLPRKGDGPAFRRPRRPPPRRPDALGRRHADLPVSRINSARCMRPSRAFRVRAGRRTRRSKSTRASPPASSSHAARARVQPALDGRPGLRRDVQAAIGRRQSENQTRGALRRSRGASASSPSTSTWFTGCRARALARSPARWTRSSAAARPRSRSTPMRTSPGCGRTRSGSGGRDLPAPR